MTISIKTSPVPPPKSTTHMNMYTLTINMLYGVGERKRKTERHGKDEEREEVSFNPDQRLVEYIHFLCTCVIVTQHKAQILCLYTSKKHDHISPLTNRGIQHVLIMD